jgi:hypothetical protein
MPVTAVVIKNASIRKILNENHRYEDILKVILCLLTDFLLYHNAENSLFFVSTCGSTALINVSFKFTLFVAHI